MLPQLYNPACFMPELSHQGSARSEANRSIERNRTASGALFAKRADWSREQPGGPVLGLVLRSEPRSSGVTLPGFSSNPRASQKALRLRFCSSRRTPLLCTLPSWPYRNSLAACAARKRQCVPRLRQKVLRTPKVSVRGTIRVITFGSGSLFRRYCFLFCTVLFFAPAAGQTLKLRDAEGKLVRPFDRHDVKAIVFIFTRTDCPISNRYAPELQRLGEEYRRQVAFWLVYPDPATTQEMARKHREQYRYSFPALLDPDHRLVKLSGAHVTPEAAVYIPDDTGSARLVYRGRIDDRFVDFGKMRPSPTRRDLDEILTRVINGSPLPETRITPAVGCFIEDLK